MSEISMKEVIEKSFAQYAGAVLQSRALVDVRDCLKPSARQIFYCLYTDKFLYDKPFKKTLKAIGSTARMYIHGDASAEGVIMRAGQPFALRYPLMEIEGSYGNLQEAGTWGAPRYTSARLSELGCYLFKDIEKNTIEKWLNNYDDTEQYPTILPSKGFFNLANGTFGIGIGASASIPSYNLKELNAALIKLLWNPDIDFEEIYCPPDFATGGILLNEEEVKQAMKNGGGSSCKIRAKIEYDSKDNTLTAVEIPYSVYTNTICKELESLIDSEENLYIERFNDLTGVDPLFKIYLKKGINPDAAIKFLYKNTSLQSYFGINFTMLEDGRFPKVFTWKEILQSYLNHQEKVYRRSFEFDLEKYKSRLHIVDGLLIALARIEEVIATIKGSKSSAEAKINLQERFLLSKAQAEAVLATKLSRLAHLEVEELKKEQQDLIAKIDKINNILNNIDLLKKEIEKDLAYVMTTFGDKRRTQILNIEKEFEEIVEEKNALVSLTNQNNLFVEETSNLYIQKRNTVGAKIKMNKRECVISSCLTATTADTILLFTNNGMCYNINRRNLINGKNSLYTLLDIPEDVKFCAITSYNNIEKSPYIIIFTKKGKMKKTNIEEFFSKKKSIKAINLDDGDSVCDVIFVEDEDVALVTKKGFFVAIATADVRSQGRATKGVRAIKLKDDDELMAAKVCTKDTKELLTISSNGYGKRTSIEDYKVNSRYTIGNVIQNLKENETIADFILLSEGDREIIIVLSQTQNKIKIEDIPILSRRAVGVKIVNAQPSNQITRLMKI